MPKKINWCTFFLLFKNLESDDQYAIEGSRNAIHNPDREAACTNRTYINRRMTVGGICTAVRNNLSKNDVSGCD